MPEQTGFRERTWRSSISSREPDAYSTNTPRTGSYVEGDAVFSPDGTQVAYHFVEIPGFNHQIRIVPVSGGTPRIVYQSKNSNSQYVFIKGWTPDGRRLLISPELHDLTWQLVMLSIADGTLQTIKSFSWTQVHADLSPRRTLHRVCGPGSRR